MLTTRFAPSPTGLLHLGHAYAALTAWRRARDFGGRFVLRLEDIDTIRCRPDYRDMVLRDLAWLGLDWDGPVRVQSQHLAEYAAVLDRLAADGLTYPCFCSRAEIAREVAASTTAPHAPDGSLRYPGTCRTLTAAARRDRIDAGAPFAIRLDVAASLDRVGRPLDFIEEGVGSIVCRPALFGDVVLGRRDAPCSYHLCVTHDDALQGVTLVTRGRDLLPATDLHRLLQALLGWPTPRYVHHALLTDGSGRRLAKRDGAVTLASLRAAGLSPSDMRHRAGFAAE